MSTNIGSSMMNWVVGAYNPGVGSKNTAFVFSNIELGDLPANKKDAFYKEQVNNLAQSCIDNYDKNNNKKMDLAEFIRQQMDMYKQIFNKEPNLSDNEFIHKICAIFANMDCNGDAKLDNSEMSAVLSLMDRADGHNDCKMSNDALNINWLSDSVRPILYKLAGSLHSV